MIDTEPMLNISQLIPAGLPNCDIKDQYNYRYGLFGLPRWCINCYLVVESHENCNLYVVTEVRRTTCEFWACVCIKGNILLIAK